MAGITAWSSPRLIRSQNFLNLQTRPTPRLSSQRLIPSSRSLTSPLHFAAIHRLMASFTLSLSIAFFFATSPGATCTGFIPGTHSFGSTALSTRVSADGRAARRRANLIETRDRASLRETTELLVRNTRRAMRSAKDGLEEDQRNIGRVDRAY